SKAVELARKHNTRLHILHLTTEDELALFDHDKPLEEKRITAEACVHHLWFTSDDYERLGAQIKCNPAIKKQKHRDALVNGLVNNNIDVIATDHAPHALEEKHQTYFNAPAGIPLIQHPLYMMLELYHQKKLSLERLVDKMCHSPAVCFQVQERGYIREGYWADLVLVELRSPWKVDSSNIYYKSSWSPLQNKIFNSQITHTFVNGHLAYQNDGQKARFHEDQMGRPLTFDAQ
ncbi:MAG: dihydroorotase, partial [Bacteroidetes bacterium SW_11_45_7]